MRKIDGLIFDGDIDGRLKIKNWKQFLKTIL